MAAICRECGATVPGGTLLAQHVWREWYFVPRIDLRMALPAAKRRAQADHPDTPLSAMQTPSIERHRGGTNVLVIGSSPRS